MGVITPGIGIESFSTNELFNAETDLKPYGRDYSECLIYYKPKNARVWQENFEISEKDLKIEKEQFVVKHENTDVQQEEDEINQKEIDWNSSEEEMEEKPKLEIKQKEYSAEEITTDVENQSLELKQENEQVEAIKNKHTINELNQENIEAKHMESELEEENVVAESLIQTETEANQEDAYVPQTEIVVVEQEKTEKEFYHSSYKIEHLADLPDLIESVCANEKEVDILIHRPFRDFEQEDKEETDCWSQQAGSSTEIQDLDVFLVNKTDCINCELEKRIHLVKNNENLQHEEMDQLLQRINLPFENTMRLCSKCNSKTKANQNVIAKRKQNKIVAPKLVPKYLKDFFVSNISEAREETSENPMSGEFKTVHFSNMFHTLAHSKMLVKCYYDEKNKIGRNWKLEKEDDDIPMKKKKYLDIRMKKCNISFVEEEEIERIRMKRKYSDDENDKENEPTQLIDDVKMKMIKRPFILTASTDDIQ